MQTHSDLIDHLLSLEAERGSCLTNQQFDRLRELLSPQLIHTHTRGNTDDRDSYLRFVSTVIRNLGVQRAGLRVVMLCDTVALMHGKQINKVCLRGQEETVHTVEATVTQVWSVADDGRWCLASFHATPLGTLPPPVAR